MPTMMPSKPQVTPLRPLRQRTRGQPAWCLCQDDELTIPALTWAAPTPAAGIAPSLTGSGSASEGGGDPTSTSTLVTSDDSPDRGKGEYAGRQDLGMPMETVLPRGPQSPFLAHRTPP